MKTQNTLRWSDVWLLMAIYAAKDRRPAALRDILAAADAIYHAVMNYEELASGLVRLEQAALIRVSSDLSHIECSTKGLEVVAPNVQRVGRANEARKVIEHQLNVTPWAPKEPIPHPANNLQYPGLTADIHNEAVNDYLESMKKRRR